jgi:hypothetical protein
MVDGSIRIDTSIDSKKFNTGIKNIITSAKSVMRAIGLILRIIAVIIAAIVGAFVLMEKSMDKTSAQYAGIIQLKESFNALKGAMVGVFYALFTAILPYLIQVVDFLTLLIIKITRFIAGMLGQKTILMYVGEATSDAADEASRLADETERAGKAAKGALAAFDQLDVLKQNEPVTKTDTAEAGSGPLFKEVPIEQAALDKVNKIRQFFIDLWNNIVLGAQTAWRSIVETWNNLVTFFQGLWNGIVLGVTNFVNTVSEIFSALVEFFRSRVIEPIVNYWGWRLNFLAIVAHDILMTIMYFWGLLSEWFKVTVIDPTIAIFTVLWDAVSSKAQAVWEGIKAVWITVSKWFSENVINPLQKTFGPVLDWIRDRFQSVFGTIGSIVKGVLNGIIDAINRMISAVAGGLNSLINSMNTFGRAIPGWIAIPNVYPMQIPRLANGAVIPGGAPFAAILGDQPAGRTNIEAPESLIRQIIQEELGNIKADIQIGFTGSLASLVRELKPYIDRENVRIGSSLIQNGITS